MTTATNIGNALKKNVKGRDADKILYFYKRIEHEPKTNKIHPLGLQGATSGTNTRTIQSTATKGANIKGVGSITQQRTVDTIFSDPSNNSKDLYWDLYQAWQNGELFGIWRVDFNTVHGKAPARKVQAQFSQCYLGNLPNTEALGGTQTSNLQFEVNGSERAINSEGNAFELDEADFEEGTFDQVTKFYNFSHGNDIGVDENGEFIDGTTDDETILVQDTNTGEDVYGPAYKEVTAPASDQGSTTPSGQTDDKTGTE